MTLLNTPAREHFLQSYTAPGGRLGEICADVPLWLNPIGLVCADAAIVGEWIDSGVCSNGTSLNVARDGRLVCSPPWQE